MEDALKEKVLAELRQKRVKLWLPPYYTNSETNTMVLRKLASEWTTQKGSPLAGSKEDDVFSALQDLQLHALNKLEEKKKAATNNKSSPTFGRTAAAASLGLLELKVLGWQRKDEQQALSFPEAWTEQVESIQIPTKKNSLTLRLHSVSPQLAVEQLRQDLQTCLQASQVRLIHNGKLLSVSNGSDSLVATILSQQQQQPSPSSVISTGALQQPKSTVSILCLVSQDHSIAAVAPPPQDPDKALIASIRQAATRVQRSSVFEITDQHGRLVSLSRNEWLSFLTALGLSRLGRKRMDDGDLNAALAFLLEADLEWSKLDPSWQGKVDNYGLLQLDISWVYLQLESLSSLPDVSRRLEIAEQVLKRQVHVNFVTLALVAADMGNTVPPLTAIFVRLFLLQGVAYRYSSDLTAASKSKERLYWAWTLCRSLRNAAPEEAIQGLAGLGISKSTAISALRRCNGDVNAAAELVETEDEDAQREWEKRERQRKLGLCENEKDYVNLDQITLLENVLGLSSGAGDAPGDDKNTKVTVGLLRLANNDVARAIDLYQDMQRSGDAILKRISSLDHRLVKEGLWTGPKPSRKRNREERENNVKVDEIALATIMSMGVDESLGRKALEKSDNNVELALLWITNRSTGAAAGKEGNSTNEDEEASSETDRQDEMETEERTEPEVRNQDEPGTEEEAERLKQKAEEDEAHELLERELGEVLRDERDMEKNYLGSSLDDEWLYIERYHKP